MKSSLSSIPGALPWIATSSCSTSEDRDYPVVDGSQLELRIEFLNNMIVNQWYKAYIIGVITMV